jgi:hypothetical protein
MSKDWKIFDLEYQLIDFAIRIIPNSDLDQLFSVFINAS